MYRSEEIQRAIDLKNDLKYHKDNNEEQIIYERDLETLDWLIEQAKRAGVYRAALTSIKQKEVEPVFYATSTLFEVDQWFEFKKNRNR